MAKTLQDYLMVRKKEYPIRIKFPFEVDNKFMDDLERYLQKFRIVDISGPERTIYQAKPVDFDHLDGAEVHIIDAVLEYPVSPWILEYDLRKKFDLGDGQVVVHNLGDEPEEQAPPEINEIGNIETEEDSKDSKEYKVKMSTDSSYPEADKIDSADYYGDEYNKGFYDTWVKETKKRYQRFDPQDGQQMYQDAKDPEVSKSEPNFKNEKSKSPFTGVSK